MSSVIDPKWSVEITLPQACVGCGGEIVYSLSFLEKRRAMGYRDSAARLCAPCAVDAIMDEREAIETDGASAGQPTDVIPEEGDE